MVKTSGGPDNGGLNPSEEEDRGSITRRGLLTSAIVVLFSGSIAGRFLTGTARADAAVTDLGVAGDSITTDDGQLTGLTASVSGHVSYDGLDTEAVSVDIELYAAPSGGAIDAAGNLIDSESVTVALTSGLDTHAGHYDYSFVDADVLAADDLAASDFSATGDGTTKDTDVDFRIAMTVKDLDGNVLVTAATTDMATISVTNEANSANAGGSGTTDAQGTNQSP